MCYRDAHSNGNALHGYRLAFGAQQISMIICYLCGEKEKNYQNHRHLHCRHRHRPHDGKQWENPIDRKVESLMSSIFLMCFHTYRQFWCLNQNRWAEEEKRDGAKIEQEQPRWSFQIETLWFYLCSLKKCSWFLRSWSYSCVVVGDKLARFPDPLASTAGQGTWLGIVEIRKDLIRTVIRYLYRKWRRQCHRLHECWLRGRYKRWKVWKYWKH